ncbi:type II secretion system F family protein [Dermatobacter hominis]|uniref:type II secretion system F family protein n=1 Tax=Dermatobacter hominis TaxID=2884263 RepID=UPI001D118203|nr:type II secretion system F family protein [Dermatobacter hominis]UDY34418.1 type II secretion system F family protein [Dermatobacter hominis]
MIASWVLAVAVAWAVAVLVVPGPRPRRFPEDDAPHADPGAVGDRARRRWRAPAALGGGPRSRRRPAPASASAPELDDLATCCDLLAVAAASGATVAGAIGAVGGVGRGPVGRALGRAATDVERGLGVADAVAGLAGALGPAAQPLATTLLTAASSGAPPAPALLRLADAERRRARRRVEARVRRLPILLLLPLVGCILPAFVLLTLVPVGLSAARGAGLTAPSGAPVERPVPAVPLPPPLPTPSGGHR